MKVIHRNRSDNHYNLSDTLPSVDTTTRALLTNTLFSSLAVKHTHTHTHTHTPTHTHTHTHAHTHTHTHTHTHAQNAERMRGYSEAINVNKDENRMT